MGESGRKTRSDNGRMFLIAVGDRAAKLAWFSLSGSEDAFRLMHDLRPSGCEA